MGGWRSDGRKLFVGLNWVKDEPNLTIELMFIGGECGGHVLLTLEFESIRCHSARQVSPCNLGVPFRADRPRIGDRRLRPEKRAPGPFGTLDRKCPSVGKPKAVEFGRHRTCEARSMAKAQSFRGCRPKHDVQPVLGPVVIWRFMHGAKS